MLWRSLRVKLVMVYTLLILFAVELIGAYFVRALTSSLIHNQSTAAKSQAQLMATLVTPQLDQKPKQVNNSITSVLQSVPQFLTGTVYILNADGYVTYTSAGGALVGQKRTDSVATQSLIHHSDAVAVRFDPLSQQHLLAVSVPITYHQTFYGVLEYVLPIQDTYDTIHEVTTIFYSGSGVVLILTIILSVILSRALTRPVLEVTRQARVMAAGDFSMRAKASSNDEFGDLVHAINHLADELDDALATNRLEQERLRAVITSMGEGVIVLNSACEVLFTNNAVRRMFGALSAVDSAELVQRLGIDEMTQEIMQGDCTRVRKVGSSIYQIIVTSFRRKDATDGFVAVVRDITEQEQLNQARKDFVSNVSHELRTPLTSIKSYIEALRELTDAEWETRTAFLGVIEQETDRMVRLTRDLLQLSGLDRGQPYNVMQLIPVSQLLEQVEQRFHLQADQQQLTFHVKQSEEQAFLRGNRDMLGRILDNLVSNAFKYTPKGGRVNVSASISKEHVAIVVEDNGIGIPDKDLPRVFERFYRVDKGRSRRLGGTGLGLALAYEMTVRQGGTIDIDSQLEVGTRVQVTFPRVVEVSET